MYTRPRVHRSLCIDLCIAPCIAADIPGPYPLVDLPVHVDLNVKFDRCKNLCIYSILYVMCEILSCVYVYMTFCRHTCTDTWHFCIKNLYLEIRQLNWRLRASCASTTMSRACVLHDIVQIMKSKNGHFPLHIENISEACLKTCEMLLTQNWWRRT